MTDLGDDALARRVLERLAADGATLATAESLTGGRLAALVTSVPGASRVFLGGVVSYATSVKTGTLGVPEELVREHGVVSAECAQAMAHGVAGLVGAAWALSTTGVAGPDPQEDQPVGTVFVGLHGPGASAVRRLALVGTRAEIQEQTCRGALALLLGAMA